MAKAKIKVQTSCRDCAMCTGNMLTGIGRSMGRAGANVATLGLAAVVRRHCKACDHAMSEHRGQLQNLPAEQAAAAVNPARWVPVGDGRNRWWDGEHWTDYHVANPSDVQEIEAAMSGLADGPPRWRQQPDGRFRWWGGVTFSDEYTRDPTGEIEYTQAAPAITASGGGGRADEIVKLAELHDAGVLTDEEFTAAKRRALGI